MTGNKITNVVLHESAVISKLPEVANERNIAIADLLEKNEFSLVDDFAGPYELTLSVKEGRLVISVASEKDKTEKKINVSLKPFNKIIKDYFLVCESYFEAVKSANTQSVEAIDMGRRGIHNEASELLIDSLEEKIKMDFNTARRLFTLMCVLHFR